MILSSAYYSFLYESSQDVALRAGFIAGLLGNRKSFILEPHAGDGTLGLELSSRGHYVTCLEDNPVLFAVMLEKFRARKELRPFFTPLPLELVNLNSETNWDLVLLSNTISFLDDGTLPCYIETINDALPVGGLVVLNSPQPIPMRQEQPRTEIHKKIFGTNVIRHLASSRFLDERSMEVHYEYETYSKNKLMAKSFSKHALYLRNSDELVSAISSRGFKLISMTADWGTDVIELDSPNCVLVAKKISGIN
jgi:hypothetical protein